MTIDGVLFDVDGSLVDTTFLHALCWSEALHQHGHDVVTSAVHRAIGMASDELLPHLLGAGRDVAKDDDLVAAHRTLYAAHWGHLRPLPGAKALLLACAARGLQVVLASSASDDELSELRRTIDADDAIACATSASDAERGKPHPDILKVALARAKLRPSRTVFVGDSVWDAKAARKARVTFVGLECGGTSEAELRAAGAVEVWRDPADLLENLGSSRLR